MSLVSLIKIIRGIGIPIGMYHQLRIKTWSTKIVSTLFLEGSGLWSDFHTYHCFLHPNFWRSHLSKTEWGVNCELFSSLDLGWLFSTAFIWSKFAALPDDNDDDLECILWVEISRVDYFCAADTWHRSGKLKIDWRYMKTAAEDTLFCRKKKRETERRLLKRMKRFLLNADELWWKERNVLGRDR